MRGVPNCIRDWLSGQQYVWTFFSLAPYLSINMILIHMEGWGVCICGNLAFHHSLIAKVVISVSCWILIRGGLCSVDRLVVHSSRPTRRVKIKWLWSIDLFHRCLSLMLLWQMESWRFHISSIAKCWFLSEPLKAEGSWIDWGQWTCSNNVVSRCD